MNMVARGPYLYIRFVKQSLACRIQANNFKKTEYIST